MLWIMKAANSILALHDRGLTILKALARAGRSILDPKGLRSTSCDSVDSTGLRVRARTRAPSEFGLRWI